MDLDTKHRLYLYPENMIKVSRWIYYKFYYNF
jgi:hypothetical protein